MFCLNMKELQMIYCITFDECYSVRSSITHGFSIKLDRLAHYQDLRRLTIDLYTAYANK